MSINWKWVRSMLCGRNWTRTKDIKLADCTEQDLRGVPMNPAIQRLILERKWSDYVDGGDDDGTT